MKTYIPALLQWINEHIKNAQDPNGVSSSRPGVVHLPAQPFR